MRKAFKDDYDGYYEIDVEDDIVPAWAHHLTPCEIQEPANQPQVIPNVSPRQIRQALTRIGLRSAVEAAVAAGDQDTKDWWEFSTVFERNNPVSVAMAVTLGVTPEQVDDLWLLADTL